MGPGGWLLHSLPCGAELLRRRQSRQSSLQAEMWKIVIDIVVGALNLTVGAMLAAGGSAQDRNRPCL